jgi:serine/threonine protein kinase
MNSSADNDPTKVEPANAQTPGRIWINRSYYIQVDEKGYVRGTCAEGALGCVLQLVRSGTERTRFALKIPRLLADTVRENAYTVQVTEHEVANAVEVGFLPGLVPVNALEEEPLRLRRAGLKSASVEGAQMQDEHVIFVCFEKGNRPRFCSVNYDESAKTFSFHPKGAAKELSELLSAETWNNLKTPIPAQNTEFKETVFCLKDVGTGQAVQSGMLVDTLGQDHQAAAWYAAVPAIIYNWATGTLQEAIGKRHLATWSFGSHFKMFKQVLTGVKSLHANDMLHGDIRPANIMSVGALDDPLLYALADYGSFGKDSARIGGEGPTGNSMTGPGVGAQRVTPFYSPERRSGIERESADTAIVIAINPTPSGKDEPGEYFIRLGWRTDLLKPNKSEIQDGVVDAMVKDHQLLMDRTSKVQFSSPEALRSGDRLRLRDYIFEIIEAGQIDGSVVCRCRKRFARIIHDRLAAYDHKEVISQKVINLSNYVEFRQWSAATDLYSVGAICLYSLFCTGIQRHGMPKTVEDPTRSVDSLFADLIRILESVPHFRIFWVQLEQFRFEFETFFTANGDATKEQLEKCQTSRGKSLKEMAFDTTNQICQGAPYAKTLLLQLDLNLCHFLLFMHFVMSCLHRQTHLEPETRKEAGVGGGKGAARISKAVGRTELANSPLLDEGAEDVKHVPFAKDRVGGLDVGKPEELAAHKAWERLEKLTFYHTQNSLSAFRCDSESEIPEFNPKPDVEIRQEITKVKDELEKSNAELQKSSAEGENLRSTNTILDKKLRRALDQRNAAWLELNSICDDVQGWKGEYNSGTWHKLWKPFADKMLGRLSKIERVPTGAHREPTNE